MRLGQGVIWQPGHLFRDGIDDLAPAVADIHTPQPGHTIEVPTSFRIVDTATLGLYHLQWRVLLQTVMLKIAVPQMLDIQFTSRAGNEGSHGVHILYQHKP